jgi:hypothetical protein
MRCRVCDRVKATQEQFDTIPQGEGEHLCWGEWSQQQCQQEAVDWQFKYEKLLQNFKNLDKYNDVLYRVYHEARSLRDITYFVGPDTKYIIDAIRNVENYENAIKK